MTSDIKPETVLAAHSARNTGFIKLDIKNGRKSDKSKYDITYMDAKLVLPDGKEVPLEMAWECERLKGKINDRKSRKGNGQLVFRKSSGKMGEALFLIYTEARRQIELGYKNGTITHKKRLGFRSIIQTESNGGDVFDDPLIRLSLPFDRKTERPMFDLFKIQKKAGKLKVNAEPVNLDNVHSTILSGMMTSGFVDMSTLMYSSQGISIPAKVMSLVIKNRKKRVPAPTTYVSAAALEAMACDDEDDEDNEEHEEEHEAKTKEAESETDEPPSTEGKTDEEIDEDIAKRVAALSNAD